ncbi:hypothetical protein RCG24_06870 [Neobacillus sp. OS1-32]|jgi:hypothetical protein|uniref:Uncharacterized protein n=1 Tax=Neobacillus paridis TaxID=2803862 RepID=A0ABS1TNT0_9BACI|nr:MULTISPECIES: hypothetical protein [Neobacillus]MBL4952902.1 hypothetical protein [Neobacillus paridis]WML31576.1 hypothetical protein RCG24_06870 [Neobacillus sp. OS1-32]
MVKNFLVLSLLASSMFVLIILLDLALGYSPRVIVQKQLQPFKVNEITAIVILSIFAVVYLVKTVVQFVKKKQK